MNIIKQIQHDFALLLEKEFSLTPFIIAQCTLTFNTDPQRQQFGDLSSNAAMIIASTIRANPGKIAQHIISQFVHPAVERIEVAGPGFLNLYLFPKAMTTLAYQLYTQQDCFFKHDATIAPKKISIEFISANPTGPLHLGHGRGGIIGDVLGNIISFLGNQVTKEFYINDAGTQMQKLGLSLAIRCQELLGKKTSLPEDAYHGSYLVDIAKQCITEHGENLLTMPDQFFRDYAYQKLLAAIKKTVVNYAITFDIWFSERTLHESGAIEHALNMLQKKGYLYEQDGARWFKATLFGDDKDRVVCKANGEYTYAAADIAYLINKSERGYDSLIMVLGHDHHSYATRLAALCTALELPCRLNIILYQLVGMQTRGELVRMSKRAGTMVTLDDVIETVGTDVARFFYLNRKADAQLTFDLDLALKKTEENPVYYIQYAYVRTGSILQKATEHTLLHNRSITDLEHIGQEEKELIKKIASLADLLIAIEYNHQTHLLTYYITELAAIFHRYYKQNKVLDLNNIPTSRARLEVIGIVRRTMALCLQLLGISHPNAM